MDFKHVVVIGASAGGIQVIRELISRLPSDYKPPIFIVFHVGKNTMMESFVARIQKLTALKCEIAENKKAIEAGRIYFARADHHLFIKKNKMLLVDGPPENRWRPSIDVLFRSAAVSFNSRCIGIVLSGLLDDGTAGMLAIKKCGGICIVQEPDEAEFSDMPQNVLQLVEVDYRIPATDIPYVLKDLSTQQPRDEAKIPHEIALEAKMNEQMQSTIEDLAKIGKHSNYTCPDCGGNLWEIQNEHGNRYRCHTGHVYTERLLAEQQGEKLEDALWTAVRLLEERKNLLQLAADRHGRDKKNTIVSAGNTKDLSEHIESLKGLIRSVVDEKNNDGSSSLPSPEK